MTEKVLMRQCCQYLDKFDNVIYWHDNDSRKNKPGKPDLEVHIRGRHGNVKTLLIELKRPGSNEEPTAEQWKWLEFMRYSQYTEAFLVYDFERFCEIINHHQMEAKRK